VAENKDISAWMKEQRLSRNLTQTELAKLLDVSTAAVASWESGARKMKPKTLVAFKTVLAGGGNDLSQVDGALKLTIRQAKEALSRNYDVSPESIEIIIKG
jgi:transcriptional regulator with XRE-family HTH domain